MALNANKQGSSLLSRWLWFVGLWCAGVISVGIVAKVLRLWIGS